MGLIKKLFGICETKAPADHLAWRVEGERILLDLSRLPELRDEGGAVCLEGKDLQTRVFVIRGKKEAFHALENRCTHMGRRLDPGEKPGQVTCCSVSGSAFDLSGNPVGGAAKRGVKSYGVVKEGEQLVVSMVP